MTYTRFWHIDLLDVMPDSYLKMLRAQCCAAAKALTGSATVAPAIEPIMRYSRDEIGTYFLKVADECQRRGMLKPLTYQQYFAEYANCQRVDHPFPTWHTERYLKQCIFYLSEKYDFGKISEKEWQKICEKYPHIVEFLK